MKPFLKWAGGKTQLLPELRARLPKKFGMYYEPFLGGGALFFNLALHGGTLENSRARVFSTIDACLNDSNEKLITTYKAIRDNVEGVITRLRLTAEEYNEATATRQRAHYNNVRAVFNSTGAEVPAMHAARFIFLNKVGFNGLYRVNSDGLFNVPWGKKKMYLPDAEGLRACSRALHGVALTNVDFEKAVALAKKGDFVYFDPPYVPASATSDFTAYSKDPFGPEEQTRLMCCARSLKSRGVHVLLSNSDTPFVRQIYGGKLAVPFKIERVEARRNINSVGAKRGKVGEVLIT